MKRYEPKAIEPKWQQIWDEKKAFVAEDFSNKPKTYISPMFPYPSGAGMHTGHTFEHAIVDAIARFYRANGHNVLNPMGWDSFGLPAENYAIKTGTPPQQTTQTNIANFKNQLQRLGASIDWTREINTSDPEYYKWTQWIFTKFFERGLAYQKESLQWWCEIDQTVLANEQVVNGKCWRHDGPDDPPAVKKSIKQWFFKITDYADALLAEIPDLNWPDKIKTAQTNWIGKSQGAEINFEIEQKPIRYVILHGYSGKPNEVFIPWLKKNLEDRGHEVYAPELPDTKTPDADAQAEFVLNNFNFDENTVLIGHSYGVPTSLKILQRLGNPIRKFISVAGFAEAGFADNKRRPFEETTNWNFDFEKIRSNVGEVELLRANNDYAVPQERSDYLLQKIGGKITDFIAEKSHVCGVEEPVVLQAALSFVKVFTTRPDTIFGATFLVLAPEHPLAKQLATDEQREAVENYIADAVKKTEIDRLNDTKEKTGVFTGSYATNPATGAKIPVWVADYVLYGYGTGAIMAVPAHDERDYAFAKKFDLDIRQVVANFTILDGDFAPRDDWPTREKEVVDAIITDGKGNYLLQIERVDGSEDIHFVGGGVDDEDESAESAIRREVLEEVGFTDISSIRQVAPFTAVNALRKAKNRNHKTWGAYYEVVVDPTKQLESEIDQGLHSVVWLPKDEVAEKITWPTHLEGWNNYLDGNVIDSGVREGVLVNSSAFDGMASSDAREKVVSWLEEKGVAKLKTTYKMRDWLISRQRYWGAPIPIIHCEEHGAVAVPEDQLPVLLPEVDDFAPKGDGKSALARVEDWVNTTCPTCGKPAKRETDTMDGYACSSWYLLRYTDPHDNAQAWKPELANYWSPVDFYVGGDHAVAHLLYVRFWAHVFHDMGLIDFKEPVKKLVYHGLIAAEDGRKMSKSLGNTVDPLEIIDQGYGADALRTFELFLGPIDENSNWSSTGIAGVYRFINRVWTLVQEFDASDKSFTGNDTAVTRLQHKTTRRVTGDIRRLSFNTAISGLMEYVNDLYKLKVDGFSDAAWRDALSTLTQLIAPFAPHVAEELWQQLGHEGLVQDTMWPAWDDALIVSDTVTIIVQVNGKLRAKLEVAKDLGKDDIEQLALANEHVQTFVDGKEPNKIIYVPGKLVNIVV